MKKPTHKASILTILIITLQLVSTTEGNARTQVLKMICDPEKEHNQTLFIPNFVGMMGSLGAQMRTSTNATAIVGTGPDGNYGFSQCYGDLSQLDCMLCYAEARTVLPGCFPNNGGRIYLDGCVMRVQNYSFYDEYTGPDDTYICGNVTRKNATFRAAVKQTVANAVTGALRNSMYFGRVEMLVDGGNESVYVLAECFRTLSPSSCLACLDNASMEIAKCLPWSEGRVLNAGCFMRYSDTNFLNPVLVASSSVNRGNNNAIESNYFTRTGLGLAGLSRARLGWTRLG